MGDFHFLIIFNSQFQKILFRFVPITLQSTQRHSNILKNGQRSSGDLLIFLETLLRRKSNPQAFFCIFWLGIFKIQSKNMANWYYKSSLLEYILHFRIISTIFSNRMSENRIEGQLSHRPDFNKKRASKQKAPVVSTKRLDKSFPLRDISNVGPRNGYTGSFGKITESTQIATTREENFSKPETTLSFPSRQSIGQNELVPGLRFGRFYGTIESATERFIKHRISQQKPEKIIGSQTDLLRQTVKVISNNDEVTAEEEFLIKKLKQLTKTLNTLETENPKLQKQNRELKDESRTLRSNSNLYEKRSDWWQKYAGQKDIEVIRRMNENFRNQMRAVNAQNAQNSSRVSSKSMYIK